MLTFATPTANAMLQRIVDRLGAGAGTAKIRFYHYGAYAHDVATSADLPLNLGEDGNAQEVGVIPLSTPAGTVANKTLTFAPGAQDFVGTFSGHLARIEDKTGAVLLQAIMDFHNSYTSGGMYNIENGDTQNGPSDDARTQFLGGPVSLP